MSSSGTSVSQLRCEYLVDPQGIDETAPRLSWQLDTDRRGARQTAYRILVSSTAEALARGEGDRWDSGRVESSQTVHVDYAGTLLRSRDECCWTVDVWDETGATLRSAPAKWTMGLLEASDWKTRWIAADPEIIRRDPAAIAPTLTSPGTPAVFRRIFDVNGEVKRATIYASARGVFEFQANGRRIGEDLFAPEWTDYHKRIHYRTYDVTSLLSTGRNQLSATLGDGWWSGYIGWQETRARYGSLENSLIVQLEIELATGGRLMIGSDASWECATGPIISSDFMMGEGYDARRELGDHNEAEDQATWLPVREVTAPEVCLVAQRSEPVRITEILTPISRHEVSAGVFIFDLGQNITGWVRLRLAHVPEGTRLVLRHGERLNPDGTLYTDNLRRAKATDTYIARGDAEEIFEPHFTFHGFQFIELTGCPGTPSLETVTGCVIHSAIPPAGDFECSHAGVNRLWLNGLWSQRDNFLSVPTDCPQRDERLGWTGDAQVFLRTASYNRDVAAFFSKWMIDVEDAQTPEGLFTDIAPRVPEGKNFVGLDDLCGAAGWADAGIIVPWTIWRVYGDRRIIERHWKAMTAWLDYLERTNPDGLRTRDLRNNYGDWLCIPSDTTFRTHSPMKNLLATAYWADDAAKMARMACAIGREAEAERFQRMFERVRDAFQKEFVLADGQLTVESQTAYVLALSFDLLPAADRARAAERLVANVRDLDWHLSTGFIGISHLNPALTIEGHADVAYRLLLQETYPSWLYPVLHGATTIWERWNGWTQQDGFFNPQMNSFNHYSLGSVGEWLFRHVAGIELDPETPGFQRFILKPFIRDGLSFARASYRTMHGEIESHWIRSGDQITWSIQVPSNTTARLFVPSSSDMPVTESGAPLSHAIGLKSFSHEQGYFVCEAVAGRYAFTSTLCAM
jgi:alpha-L-rhamnosidase